MINKLHEYAKCTEGLVLCAVATNQTLQDAPDDNSAPRVARICNAVV